MPYITLNTGMKLTDSEKNAIITRMGDIITVIPNKNIDNMMLHILDEQYMVFAGKQTESCIFMQIQLHLPATHAQKSKLVEDTIAMLSEITKIPASNIYLNIEEYDNWGALGKYL